MYSEASFATFRAGVSQMHINFRHLNSILSKVLVFLIRIYQRCISPALGPRCRFYPTCSEYTRMCLENQGVLVGGTRAFLRICRCHPWHPGGIDFPFEDNLPSAKQNK